VEIDHHPIEVELELLRQKIIIHQIIEGKMKKKKKHVLNFYLNRPSPRPDRSTRDQGRHRSPRPPPTIHQSTQRTIVYMHESSSSKQHSK
jgi:hypothetical protein